MYSGDTLRNKNKKAQKTEGKFGLLAESKSFSSRHLVTEEFAFKNGRE